jgi:hypothetical protein
MTTKENMRSHTDACGRIKELGFAPSKRVRMYGESFEIVSEPFPEGDGISVYAITEMMLKYGHSDCPCPFWV